MQTTHDFTDYFSTVTEWVARQPDQIALGYLEEGAGELTERAWTYAELVSHATAVAARLREDLEPGDRTLLLYPPGLPFVAAFLGCLAAGVVAVPAPLPDGRDKAQHRLAGIIADAGTRVVLTESSVAPLIAGWADALPTPIALIATDAIPVELGREFVPVRSAPSDTAFLQYTSGSTNAPKGVIVTHGNLVHNEQELGARIENDPSFSMLSWLPQFHDMGLIGMLLWPLFYGGTSRFLSPVTFIKHPIQWIRAMSKYRATVGVAPNFAFDLVARRCTHEALEGVDLSCVRSLLNGSEPVQWASIERFTTLLAPFGLAEHAVTPVYGLAEATLFVTGDPHGTPVTTAVVDGEALAENRLVVADEGAPRSRVLVASGRIGGIEVSVVGADGAPLPDGEIGEIWLRGTSVAAGYWNLPELSAEIFGATPIGGTGGWLRTGDLGTLVDGNLFITGRTKDVIIVNGRNLYAHDIEAAARAAAPALARGVGAAFAVGTPERLVLVHEIRPENLGDASLDDVLAAVRTAIFAEFATPLSDLVLVAKGEVARTTSGKIRRTHMRASYEGGRITAFADPRLASAGGDVVR